jgi:hypothetical protein
MTLGTAYNSSSNILQGVQPNSLGGNTANYESKGGYIPKIRKTNRVHRGGRKNLKRKSFKRRKAFV